MTHVFCIRFPVSVSNFRYLLPTKNVLPTSYQSKVHVDLRVVDKLVFVSGVTGKNATNICIPKISSFDLSFEWLSLQQKREEYMKEKNISWWEWNFAHDDYSTPSIASFMNNLFIEHEVRSLGELVPVVTVMYDSVPPKFLELFPSLSDFFFCVFDLLHSDDPQVETACRLHKASVYSQHALFKGARIETSVLSVLAHDNCIKQNPFRNDRGHSEYFASSLGVPLVLVKRGTIFRIIRQLLSAVESELACGKLSRSRIILGWKQFVTLPCKMLLSSPEKEKEPEKEYKTVFTPTTHVLFKNIILKTLADYGDKKGSMFSEVWAQYALDIAYGFGCGHTSSVFIPPSEVCDNDNDNDFAEKLVENPFMSDPMYHVNVQSLTPDSRGYGAIVPPPPSRAEISGEKFLVSLPQKSPVYNVSHNFGDTVSLCYDPEPTRILSLLKTKTKKDFPVFFTMLLKELETILIYCQLVGQLSPQQLIKLPKEEVIFTSHHLSYRFLCDTVKRNCFRLYQEMYRDSFSYKYFSKEHGNRYWSIIPKKFMHSSGVPGQRDSDSDSDDDGFADDDRVFTGIRSLERDNIGRVKWNSRESRATVGEICSSYREQTNGIDLESRLFSL